MVELAKVQEILMTVCPHDANEITPDKRLVEDLEIDSFSLMEMVITFENEFNIEIPDRDLRLFDTVDDIIKYIEKKLSKEK
ncbi:MAG: acyl carrier protein [Christensenellaceae bacterium]